MTLLQTVPKGSFGYLESMRKRALLRSIFCVALCLIIFLVGLVRYGSNKSVFSIIAALGCLPTGISIVNYIMFLHALPCSARAHERIEAVRGGLLVQYDLYMTGQDRNFPISAACVMEGNVCCLAEDPKLTPSEAEKHIRLQISQSGYTSETVKVFQDLDAFCMRLSELEQLRMNHGIDPLALEDAWEPGTRQTIPGILRSISL